MAERLFEADVLVVGGGGAGLRAAISAREKDLKVVLLSKGPLARCGATPMAGADFTLDGYSLNRLGFKGEPKDSKEKFFSDILHQGFQINNQRLLEHYVRMAPERLKELMDWGINIRNSDERAIYTTGIEMADALLRRARSVGVDTLEDIMLIDLVVQEGKVVGALGLDIKNGEFMHFRGNAVVIATGGWHKAFWPNTGMRDLSGDGIAIAHRAGADIGNMEFITFCCNVLYSPPFCRGSIATYIMSLRCPFELTNSLGEIFLDKYDPYVVQKGTTMEWNKCFLSFAETKEVREGKGSPNCGLYYSRGNTSWEEFEEILIKSFPNWKYKALDLGEIAKKIKDKVPVEIGPAVEYFDGGIVVNERFETNVEGLYAAGECTLGPFGANRICAATTEMLVHGATAGEQAGYYAKDTLIPQLNQKAFRALEEKAESALGRSKGLAPAKIRRSIQEMAHRHLGSIRNEEELKIFIDFLDSIKKDELPQLATTSKSRIYNKEWIDALELKNIVHLLECAARSALFRTESRGVHYREDYPDTDNDKWLYESILKLEDDTIEIFKRTPTLTTIIPHRGTMPYLEMLKKMMEAHSDVGGRH